MDLKLHPHIAWGRTQSNISAFINKIISVQPHAPSVRFSPASSSFLPSQRPRGGSCGPTMHCKFPHRRTTAQTTLPRCAPIASSGGSASVWAHKNLMFPIPTHATCQFLVCYRLEHSLWWGRAGESSVSSSVCHQVLPPRLPRLRALTTRRKGCLLSVQ